MSAVIIKDKEQFVDEFTKNILDRFGTLNKNDYEVLIYYLLQKYSDQVSKKTPFATSVNLRIPESKIKRLAYEAELIYGEYDRERLISDFFEILYNSTPVAKGKALCFAITDKYLRLAIQSELYSIGSFGDYSFNSDIITISFSSLMSLLEELNKNHSAYKAFERRCIKAIKEEFNRDFSWTEVGQALANATASEIPSLIKALLLPHSTVEAAISAISKLFKKYKP